MILFLCMMKSYCTEKSYRRDILIPIFKGIFYKRNLKIEIYFSLIMMYVNIFNRFLGTTSVKQHILDIIGNLIWNR